MDVAQILQQFGFEGGVAAAIATVLVFAVKFLVDALAKRPGFVGALAVEIAKRLTDPTDTTTPTLKGVEVEPPAKP